MRRSAVRPVAMAVLGLVVVFSVVWWVRQPRGVGYHPEVVWTATWGPGNGQVGQARGRDGRVYGPKSFALSPGGTMWVLDSANARLVPTAPAQAPVPLIDSRGTRVFGAEDLAVTADGEFWAADNAGQRLLRRARTGEWEEAPLVDGADPGAPLGRVEALWAPAGRRVFAMVMTVSAQGFHRRFLAAQRGVPLAQALQASRTVADSSQSLGLEGKDTATPMDGDFQQVVPGGRDRLYALRPEGAGEVRISVHGPLGKLQREAILRLEGASRVELIGVDRSGRICLGLDLGTPGGRVAIYAPNGRPLATLPAESSGEPSTLVWARVSPDGRIYIAYLDKSGYRLVGYKPR